jgi:hypothetical protein
MKVNKAERLVAPKKIRKMYRQAVRESLDNGLAKESRKVIWRYRIALIIVIVYGLAVTSAAIVGACVVAGKFKL